MKRTFTITEAQAISFVKFYDHQIEAETEDEALALVSGGEEGELIEGDETEWEYGDSGFGTNNGEAMNALCALEAKREAVTPPTIAELRKAIFRGVREFGHGLNREQVKTATNAAALAVHDLLKSRTSVQT